MLDDLDASVVINAILVLEELNIDKGGLLLSPEMLMKLLGRIGEFTEWGALFKKILKKNISAFKILFSYL